MKKNHIVLAALAALMISSVPAHGMSEQAKKPKKNVLIAQFDESLSRVKRCFRGECTKMEAVKVVRDLIITTAAVITAMYVTGSAIEQGALKHNKAQLIPIGRALKTPASPLTNLLSAYRTPRIGSLYQNRNTGEMFEVIQVDSSEVRFRKHKAQHPSKSRVTDYPFLPLNDFKKEYRFIAEEDETPV